MSVIACDVDGVLAAFIPAYNDLFITTAKRDDFTAVINKVGAEAFPSTWDYPQRQCGYTEEEAAAVWTAIKRSTTWWQSLAPTPQCERLLEVLSALRATGHDVYFVTTRPGRQAKMQTESWLRALDYALPTVIIANSAAAKGAVVTAIGADIFIDDYAKNVEATLSAVREAKQLGRVYLVDRPYNQETVDDGVTRVAEAIDALAIEGLL